MIKFEFVEENEFANHYYEVSDDGQDCAVILYFIGSWTCKFYLGHLYGDVTLIAISEKIKELNESLAKQRKEYFGLI